MPNRLPPIDIAVQQSSQDAVQALADAARSLEIFDVEAVNTFSGEEGFYAANLRYLKPSQHQGLGIQFIAFKDQKKRVSVEVRASQWSPEDPPTYNVYCDAARQLANPILKKYNAINSTRCRLRIPTKQSMTPRLSPASEINFNRFVALANKSTLHPLDWRRFYQFVWNSRGRPLSEDDMQALLESKGFTHQYAADIASIYLHLGEFKAMK